MLLQNVLNENDKEFQLDCQKEWRVPKCNERGTNIFIGVSTTLGAAANVLHLRNPHSIICGVTHRLLYATTIFIQPVQFIHLKRNVKEVRFYIENKV